MYSSHSGDNVEAVLQYQPSDTLVFVPLRVEEGIMCQYLLWVYIDKKIPKLIILVECSGMFLCSKLL